jgi:hypothetical protein
MRVCHRINEFEGIVQSVSKDKTEITLSLPRGGTIKAPNAGFEVGEKVCFFMNPAETKIVKVIPKLVADVARAVGESPILAHSIMERPDEEDEDFDEYQIEDPDEPVIIEEIENECGREITGNAIKRENEAEFTISSGYQN